MDKAEGDIPFLFANPDDISRAVTDRLQGNIAMLNDMTHDTRSRLRPLEGPWGARTRAARLNRLLVFMRRRESIYTCGAAG